MLLAVEVGCCVVVAAAAELGSETGLRWRARAPSCSFGADI